MVLSTRFSDGVKCYTDLGRQFHVILKEVSPERFKEAFRLTFGNPDTQWEGCYGFIVHHNGQKTEPLYEGFENCLMTDSEEVFRDLSFR